MLRTPHWSSWLVSRGRSMIFGCLSCGASACTATALVPSPAGAASPCQDASSFCHEFRVRSPRPRPFRAAGAVPSVPRAGVVGLEALCDRVESRHGAVGERDLAPPADAELLPERIRV